jgi:hypothetical protein
LPFYNVFVLTRYLIGIACIHLFWLYFYLVGSLAWTPVHSRSSDDTSRAADDRPHLLDLVITTVTGISITGFILFFLGTAGLLNMYGLALCLVLQGLLFWFGRQEKVFGYSFWGRRFRRLGKAATIPALILYTLFLVLAVPAVLPPTLWDSISYHLAYAVDFTNAEKIYVDEFLRFPYYTNNFLLINAVMFILKLEVLCHFLTWLCGLLTCLGIYAFLAERPEAATDVGSRGKYLLSLRNILLVLSLALSPVFLRFLNVAYVDIPIGLFVLVPVLCVYLALSGRASHYEASFILVAAFGVGMKITQVLLLPLFVVALFVPYLRRRTNLRATLMTSLLLLTLSGPWYIRNMIATGDPLSPTINILLKGRDPIFSLQDYQTMMLDLETPKDVISIVSLPVMLFLDPLSLKFREYGITLIIMLLYLPVVSLLLLVIPKFRQAVGHGFIYLNVALVYLIVIWIGTSSLGRYFLHLFPVYVCYIGACVNGLAAYVDSKFQGRRVVRIPSQATAVALPLFMLTPSPTTSKIFLDDMVQTKYHFLAERLQNRKQFLRENLPGYASTQLIVTTLKAEHREDMRVLTLGFENLAFYFRRNKLVSMGDWIGPGRYRDLIDSMENGDLGSYLDRFRVGAVLVNLSDMRIPQEKYGILRRRLQENGFVLMESPEGYTDIYLRARRGDS